ncbi:MAG: flagellar basal body P-ring formation protein FlgA [Chromatiales bacterium]|jgi:flagellar basal body P-ring formation protein FlgA|nr:flagellar basal body P-ring formation protein FlgA [Chromatiales bacterium]
MLTALVLAAVCLPVFAVDGAVQSLASIRQVAASFAQESAQGTLKGDARVRPGRLDSRLRLAPCEAPLEAFRPRGGRALGNITVGVRCPGPKLWTIYVPVNISMPGKVLVATQYIPRGEHLRAEHVRLEQRDLATLMTGYFSAVESAVGKRLKRPLAMGSVVTPRMLASPKLVRRGTRVTIIVRRPGLEIRAAGKALRDGAAGDVVPVRNLATRRLVEGTVDSAGVVTVRM